MQQFTTSTTLPASFTPANLPASSAPAVASPTMAAAGGAASLHPDALMGWQNSVHVSRIDAHLAPEEDAAYAQHATPNAPRAAAVSDEAWEAACAVWERVAPEVAEEEMSLAALSPVALTALLGGFGLPTDLSALRQRAPAHRSARQWLIEAAAGELSPAAHAFVTEHAPALWVLLQPELLCLELIHGSLWMDTETFSEAPLADQAVVFEAALALLPAEVTNFAAATPWLGQHAPLKAWFDAQVERALCYTPADETDSLLHGARMFAGAAARFTAEPQREREAWHLQRLVLRWRAGERADAEAGLCSFRRENPGSVQGALALATALAGNLCLAELNRDEAPKALVLLKGLEHKTRDAGERGDILALRDSIKRSLTMR